MGAGHDSVGSVVPNERTDSREDVEDGVRHGHERSFSGVDEEQHLRQGSRAREVLVPGGGVDEAHAAHLIFLTRWAASRDMWARRNEPGG